MAQPFTDNNGTTFYNKNICRSFRVAVSATLFPLTNQVCSEVIIINRTSADVYIYDNGYSSLSNAFVLSANESFTFRGVTNAASVSAQGAGSGFIYYRTQYYSQLPQM